MTFAKIYPELLESILLCENLGMELVNVTSRTNNLMEEIEILKFSELQLYNGIMQTINETKKVFFET